MNISYKRLWKLLIDRDMKKMDLVDLANISRSSVAKLGRNEPVSLDIILKICNALNCDMTEVVETVSED